MSFDDIEIGMLLLWIDDQDVGMAPVPITIRRFFQAHSIRVELPGYRPYEIELTTEARLLPRLRFGVTHPLVMMGKRPPPLVKSRLNSGVCWEGAQTGGIDGGTGQRKSDDSIPPRPSLVNPSQLLDRLSSFPLLTISHSGIRS